jgi:hypothetical protein
MRKRLITVLAAAAAIALAVAVTASAVQSPTLTGPDGNTQSIGVKIAPKKLSKKKQTPISLEVQTNTSSTTNPSGVPVPAVRAILDFDKDARIFTKGYPTCDQSQIEGKSTEEAERACHKAKIGGGSAHALLPVGKKVFTVEQTVTAFNGKPQGGHPVVLLHSYGTTPLVVSTVLVGKVSNYNQLGYGPRRDVTIPPLAGGQGALTDFQTTIKKIYRFKGKRRSYVSASCPDRKLKARGQFVFADGQSLTPKVEQKCTPRG